MQAKTVYIQLGEFIPTKKSNDYGAKASYVDPCYETFDAVLFVLLLLRFLFFARSHRSDVSSPSP